MAGPITLWAEGERRFTLEEKDGRLELTLHEHNRVIRSEGCKNEHEARDKAHHWLIALEVMRDESSTGARPALSLASGRSGSDGNIDCRTALITMDSRLDVLARFHVRTVARRTADTVLISGIFSRPEQIAVDDRGWLFVGETESTIADVVSADSDGAGLDTPNWSMTRHVHVGAVLPWLDGHWQARDLAFMLDTRKQWRRVKYEPTDAVVFAKRTLKCARCGWTGSIETTLDQCPKCASELSATEIFGNQEAAFPLDADSRFVETRPRLWDHDHCLICDVAVGRDVPFGYRESSFADGPNSLGIWLCEACFERYPSRGDFSFLVRRSINQ